MSTTFTELVQVQATLSGVGTLSLSTGLHATLNGIGTMGAAGGFTMGFVSGGVTYRALRSSMDGLGTITAPLSVQRNLQATLLGVGALVIGAGGKSRLPAFVGISGNSAYAGARGSLVAMRGHASDPILAPSIISAIGVLPALRSTTTGLTGELGTGNGSLAALVGQASNFAYGGASSKLPPLRMRANDEQTAFGLGLKNYLVSTAEYDVITEYHLNMTETAELTAAIGVLRNLLGDMAEEMDSTGSYDVLGEYSVSMSATMQILAGLERTGQQLIWVTNSDTGANATYRGWEFNSFGFWMGKYYGASENGLFELVGDTDDGAPIISSVLTGKSDLGTVQQKRVAHVYVGGSASGDLTLTVHTDDGATNDYVISAKELIANSRTEIGKALRAKYWQFEITNTDGSDFSLESLELLPDITTRRI